MRRTTLTGILAALAGIGAGGILIVGIATPYADGENATRLFYGLVAASSALGLHASLGRRRTVPLPAAAAYDLGLEHGQSYPAG
ncbi:hypothetical protein [Planomonospora parontospora]|nr:hypothetical protein [Planomonospora parontospora]